MKSNTSTPTESIEEQLEVFSGFFDVMWNEALKIVTLYIKQTITEEEREKVLKTLDSICLKRINKALLIAEKRERERILEVASGDGTAEQLLMKIHKALTYNKE